MHQMKKYFLILLMSGVISTHHLRATNPSVIAWLTYQEKKRATCNRLREIDNLTKEIVRERSQLEHQQILLNESKKGSGPSVVYDSNHPALGIAVIQDWEGLQSEIEKKQQQIRMSEVRLFQLVNASKR